MKRSNLKCQYIRNPIIKTFVISGMVIAMLFIDISIILAQPTGLSTGDRVRIWSVATDGKAVSGDVVALYPQSVQVYTESGFMDIPYNSIRQLRVARGRRSNTLQGMAIGIAGGALFGGLVGAAGYSPCTSTEMFGCFMSPSSRTQSAQIGAIAGGFIGGIVGLFIGAGSHSTRWENITVKPSLGLIPVYPGNSEYKPAITFRVSLNTR